MKYRNKLQVMKLNHHNLEISNTRYIEKVFANVRQKLNRPEEDQIVVDQKKVNVLIWEMKHVNNNESSDTSCGKNYNDNLFTYRNTNFEALKTLFDITQKLILNQKHEITHVSTMEWQFTSWMRSTLLLDKVVKLSKTLVHICSDSVLCLEKVHRHPDAMVKWKEQPQNFQNSNEYRALLSKENHLSSSGPRTHYGGDSPRNSCESYCSQNKV